MRAGSLLPPDWPGGWPPSNYPILLAILLLLATAIGLVVSSESTANELATYAYYALVIGVVLRIAEHAAEDRLRPALAGLARRLDEAVTDAIIDGNGRVDDAEDGDRLGRTRSARSADRPDRRTVHEIARYTLAATAVGGVAVLFYWELTGAGAVQSGFLLGWTLAVWVLASLSIGMTVS